MINIIKLKTSKNKFKKLLKLMEEDKILTLEMFGDPEEYDDLCDLRDLECFEDKWIEVDELCSDLEDKIDDLPEIIYDLYRECIDVIDEIEQVAFLKTLNMTGHDDLSAFVSEDFILILKSYCLGSNNRWLISLFNYYAQNKFAYKELDLTRKSFNAVMSKILKR